MYVGFTIICHFYSLSIITIKASVPFILYSEIRKCHQFSSVAQSCPTLCTPWTAAPQTSLSIINSQSPSKLKSIESVMPSNHLILRRSLLLLPSIFPSIKVFSNKSTLCIRWPKYGSFSFRISPSRTNLL